jgi:hypothetical protein
VVSPAPRLLALRHASIRADHGPPRHQRAVWSAFLRTPPQVTRAGSGSTAITTAKAVGSTGIRTPFSIDDAPASRDRTRRPHSVRFCGWN